MIILRVVNLCTVYKPVISKTLILPTDRQQPQLLMNILRHQNKHMSQQRHPTCVQF
jgi:hypothetical protein